MYVATKPQALVFERRLRGVELCLKVGPIRMILAGKGRVCIRVRSIQRVMEKDE